MNNDELIIVAPDSEILKRQVEKLRTELSMLVLEHDELVYVECKNIEMRYLLNIGGLEYRAYKLQCKILRQKRKIELIQARKNRMEEISITKIDEFLDEEFADYQETLNSQVQKMNDAIRRSKAEILSDSEQKELKKLYRTIVKTLHPDLHPEQAKEMKALFLNATDAYECGDLAGLRIIYEMVGEPQQDESDSSVKLLKEKERLEALLEQIKSRIKQIKTEYPYTMKELVQSKEKTEEKKKELKTIIFELEELLDIYNKKIKEMLRKEK